MAVPTPATWKASTCPTLPSASAQTRSPALTLSAFCRLDELGVVVSGQRLEPGRTVLACRVAEGLRVAWNTANDAVPDARRVRLGVARAIAKHRLSRGRTARP